MLRGISIVALSAVLAAPGLAQTAAPDTAAPDASAADISGTYVFVPEHSQIVFSYDHMGFSISRGFINGVEGSVTLDGADPRNSTVEARFPLSSVRTVAPALDEHMFGEGLLADSTPETVVTFRSTRVELDDDDDDEARVIGDLTLNGVTREVTLEVELNKFAPSPITDRPTAGFEIEGKIRRSDFNMGAFAPAVSDEMEIEIAVEAQKN